MRTLSAESIVLAVLVASGSVIVLTWAPWLVSFSLAVTAAICWCIWLERHPTA